MKQKIIITSLLMLFAMTSFACQLSPDLANFLLGEGLIPSDIDDINNNLAQIDGLIVIGCDSFSTDQFGGPFPDLSDLEDMFFDQTGQVVDLSLIVVITSPADGVILSLNVFDSVAANYPYTVPQGEGAVIFVEASITVDGLPFGLINTSVICGQPISFDPTGDADGDGILNGVDNCLRVPNPSQEDGWGTVLGDACDTSLYDSRDGVKAFQQKDDSFNLFGNCRPDGDRTKCLLIANIQPAALVQTEAPQRFQSSEAEGWYVEVYLVGIENGSAVYQVNTYDANGTLQDDGLEIVVGANGAVSWR